MNRFSYMYILVIIMIFLGMFVISGGRPADYAVGAGLLTLSHVGFITAVACKFEKDKKD